MRKLTGAVFLSLDGVMQAPGGPDEDPTSNFRFGGWVQPFWGEDMGPFEGIITGEYDLLLGKRTYDIFAAYWPYAPDEMADIRDPFNDCTKYVVTHGDQPLEWRNSRRVGAISELQAIKQGEGPDLIIQGSSMLYPQLLEADLIDELTLMISPIVLGQGKRLFGDGTRARTLKMTGHKVSDGGNIVATYQPAGPVKTGTYVTGAQSDREKVRQVAMAEGSW